MSALLFVKIWVMFESRDSIRGLDSLAPKLEFGICTTSKTGIDYLTPSSTELSDDLSFHYQ